MGLAIIFVLGLIFGSLANLVVLRLHTSEPIISGRSQCLYCGKRLNLVELIPFFSFIIQKGRCRACSSRLSLQYPVVEGLAAGLFLLIWLNWTASAPVYNLNNFLVLLWQLSFWYLLFLASLYDIKHQILPEEFVLPGILLAAIGNLIFYPETLLVSLASGFSIFALFILLWLITKKRGIGLGDGKMALALGIFLSFPLSVFGFVFSFWLGSIFGLSLLALKKAKMKTPIPFGPFLFSGNFIAFLLKNFLLALFS